MEWVESTGTSIDEAKEHALDRLGVHEDDAEFEVLADVTTGLFGRVKEEARVRARVAPSTPPAKEERRRGKGRGGRNRGGGNGGGRGGNGGGNAGNRGGGGGGGRGRDGGGGRGGNDGGRRGGRDGGSSRADRDSSDKNESGRGDRSGNDKAAQRSGKKETTMSDEPMMPLPQQADLAEEFVRGLAERFGTTVAFERTEVDEEEIRITVSGDDLGRMVGRRGTTAGAIDDLVRTVLQRQAGSSRNGRIRVDIGGVRARRAEALAAFSREQAVAVRESGNARSLEPMSAADRKVVHDALTDEDGVDTISEGEDAQRRVVIIPAGD